jgi:hypothetical protein
MSVYVYTEALQKLTFLLEEAFKKGEVRIQRDDGQVFIITPERQAESPLDAEGIHLGITTQEIIECIHEGRKLN